MSGPNAYVSVESLNEVPGKLRGVTHVFARQVSFTRDTAAVKIVRYYYLEWHKPSW